MSVVANQRIDFHQLAKPANLRNSAVLRMLEEEENRRKNGQPPRCALYDTTRLRRRRSLVKWPPASVALTPSDPGDLDADAAARVGWRWWKNRVLRLANGGRADIKQVVWPPPPDSDEYPVEEAPIYAQGGPQHYTQETSPVQHNQQQQEPTSPAYQPHQAASPQFNGASNRWAPVASPVHQAPQPQYQPQVTQAFRPVKAPSPPPAIIQLRPAPPISQAPAPVYTSQPATATLNGGSKMRGDMKWPPASVKAQSEAENEQRKLLAKGPAFRPRKVKKDYSSFFAQHALNSTYPGYRAPPGTQHYQDEQPGISNF